MTIAALAGYSVDKVVQDDNLYRCADSGVNWVCDGFSQYYSLSNGKCLNSQAGNKLCRSGWDKVDIVADPTDTETEPPTSSSGGTWGQSFVCKSGGVCKAIS